MVNLLLTVRAIANRKSQIANLKSLHVPRLIQTVNPLKEAAAWDDLVSQHPDATFFHTSAWARALHESYGFTPMFLVCSEDRGRRTEDEKQRTEDGGRKPQGEDRLSVISPQSSVLRPLPSALPLMEVCSPITGRRGVSLPFTDACPPLLSDASMLKALLSRLASLGQAHHWKYWECRDVTNLPPDACPSVSFHAHTLDLSTGEQALFRGLKSSVRTAVRKAEQAGVQVETSTSLQSLQTFYDLHCKTRRKHGLPPQPFRFFRALHRHVLSQGFGRVLIATTGQIPVAANVYFHWQKKAIYKYGASDHAGQELRASNLLMWRAIQGYASQGFHSLHLGRTSINTQSEGLRRFKLGWGTKEERINYLRYDCQQDRYVVCKDEAFGWYNSLMTRMPILFLRILGSLLYRHVG